MMKIQSLKLCLLGLAVALITACSGSGSSGNSVQTGKYKDAGAVAGLHYATATQSGTTGTTGEFLYLPGETVTFSLGNIVLGSAPAAATVTTFDLAGIKPPTTGLGIPNNTPASFAFQQVANISTMLQTLDEDNNIDNGIQIPAQAASLATTNLNFYQSYIKFNSSWSFRQFIGNCRAAGLWGGTRAIKKTGYALNALYQGLGLSANLGMPTEEATSLNGNTTRNVYTYDANGNLIKTESFNTSNVLTGTTVTTYNANGDILSSTSYDANNQATGRYTSTYNANGYETGISIFGSTNNLTYQATITVDVYGNQTDYVNYTAFDQSTYRQTLTYNNLGQLETLRTYNGSGALIWYQTSTYSNSGTLPAREDNYDANGVLTDYVLYTYNSRGDELTYNSYNASNVLQEQRINTYDSNGNVIQLTGLLGGVQYTETFTYNSDGYLTLRQYSNNQSVNASQTYAYDVNGNLISTTAGSLIKTRSYSPTNLWEIQLTPIYVGVG